MGETVLKTNQRTNGIHPKCTAVGKHKTNEPGRFKEHLPEILEHVPQLRIFTGDALYLQKLLLGILAN